MGVSPSGCIGLAMMTGKPPQWDGTVGGAEKSSVPPTPVSPQLQIYGTKASTPSNCKAASSVIHGIWDSVFLSARISPHPCPYKPSTLGLMAVSAITRS